MINNVSFQGRRVYDYIKILQEPLVEKTTLDEDQKDFSQIMEKLNNTDKKDIHIDRNAGFLTPVVKTDEYVVSSPQSFSLGDDVRELNITNIKEHITRIFSANSDSHDVRQLFKQCLTFMRNSISKDTTPFKG